jgi:formylglycine-generating enzyme required for sulfatase activity
VSRIFLSHSSRNNAEALAMREWLASQGWNDVFLDIDPERGLVAADRWQKALNAAIGRCRAVIFLLSPEWRASEHCISEFDLAGHVGAERIGVIIKEIAFDKLPVGLGGENQLVNLARGGTPISFTVSPPPARKSVEVRFPAEDLKMLRSGLARLGLVGFDTESFAWPPADEPHRAPFRGLEPLDVKDAGVFFGRDADLVRAREELIELRAKGGRKLFVIQGASGSGKSSFMRAGLLPRLEREDRDFVALPLIRPGTAALSGRAGLAVALEQAFEKLHRSPAMALGHLQRALANDSDALPPLLNEILVLATKRLVGDAKPQVDRPPTLVLAIDQAEELFTPDAGQEAAKLRQHLTAALTRGPDTIGLLTIRSDRFPTLQNDDLLKKLLEPFNLPPLEATVYRDAILRPAARITPPLEIHPELTEALIEDTAAEGADPLPLLAFTMERLYREYGKEKGGLVPRHYKALKGIAGSIDAAIDEAFAKPGNEPPIPIDQHERERRLEAAFLPALVDINQANGEPVSRIAKESEIPVECRNLIQRLVNARLLVSDEAPNGKEEKTVTTYRVAHEALLRRWDWLKSVLGLRAGELTIAQLIEGQAEAWDKAKRDKAWLDLKGDRLRDAIAVRERKGFRKRLEGVPEAYIAACRKLERSVRRRRWWTQAAIYTLLLAVIGGLLARMYERELRSLAYWGTTFRVHQLAAADIARLKPGDAFSECARIFSDDRQDGKQISKHCPDMVVIPAGSYRMGGELSGRVITINKPFGVSRFTITFDQWDACVAGGGCESNSRPSDQTWGRGTRPVINVDWRDARNYVAWLNRMTGTNSYRLLSEAEWEYAARGVTSEQAPYHYYSWGNEIGRGNANCVNCGTQWDDKQTAPVGSFKSNAFGLYDMHGNVWQWVEDCYAEDLSAAPTDGSAWREQCKNETSFRDVRGGAWLTAPTSLGSSNRYSYEPGDRRSYLGFRVARVLSPAGTRLRP